MVLFQETQKFGQWWLWMTIPCLLLIPAFFFNRLESFVDQWTIDKIITSVLVVGILVLFLASKMTTNIADEKIRVSFFSSFKREFFWDGLQQAQIIDYLFIGVWGIRIGTSYGTIYNLSGCKRIHIKTVDKQYVIGTQKEKELRLKIAYLLR
ncbi:MAG: hypothetical protein ACJAWA_000171 [Nonlabens sp.]|jgi:hypothetical protein